MEAFIIRSAELRVAMRPAFVERFEAAGEDGERSLVTISGVRLPFVHARPHHCATTDFRPLPALFRRALSRAGATELLILDGAPILVVAPTPANDALLAALSATLVEEPA